MGSSQTGMEKLEGKRFYPVVPVFVRYGAVKILRKIENDIFVSANFIYNNINPVIEYI